MIALQFKLTAPSVTQMSTELDTEMSDHSQSSQVSKCGHQIKKTLPPHPTTTSKPPSWPTHSSHSLTLSNDGVGIELMCIGGFVKSEKMKTRSKFFKPNWTRSRCAISTSARVMTRNGGSVRCTRQSVVGCKSTFVRKGTPLKPSSRNGTSTSTRPSDWQQLTHARARQRSPWPCYA